MGKSDNDYLILIHFGKDVEKLWSSLLSGEFKGIISPESGASLLDIFIQKVQAQGREILFASEEKGVLSEKLASSLDGCKVIPFRHEIAILKEHFQGSPVPVVMYDSVYPLLDTGVEEKIGSIHNEYSADYSYAENLPEGITGRFFSRYLFEALQVESEEKEDSGVPEQLPVSLHRYIESNLNHFHAEIHYEAPDLRMLRLNYSCKTIRSTVATLGVVEALGDQAVEYPYSELEGLFNTQPGLLYHFPSYIEIEPFSGCEYRCTFCLRTTRTSAGDQGVAIGADQIKQVLSYVETGYGDTTVALGGQGEPLQHPDPVGVIKPFLESSKVRGVILETNGRYLDKLKDLYSHSEIEKLTLVINVNSFQNYGKLHGVDQSVLDEVQQGIARWVEHWEGSNPAILKNTYIQTLKIMDNEAELDQIFEYTRKNSIQFLLQKFNTFAGRLDEQRVSDMTPLERSFCWHLRRDLYLDAGGDVLYCKQAPFKGPVLGNLGAVPLAQIWSERKGEWENNYRERYPQEPACASCDEYYTFNM